MKGSRTGFNGGGGGGAPPTDLLVCFPSRAHLTLMPKPICSPSRQNSDPSKRSRPRPLFRTRTQTQTINKTQLSSDIGSEPTSPKVTCAGQIKVRHKNQNRRHHPKNWVESLGLKKDVMNFLGALRSLRFNMHCFGSFHGPVDCCSDEEEEQEDVGGSHSRNVFSKWFMLLEEKEEEADDECEKEEEEEGEEEEEELTPPKNALLLMRCRSAPAKGWLGAEEEVKEVVVEKEEGDEERLMLMSYAPDFFKVSTEIAKETWVVGSVDPLARSRSWKR